MLNTREGRKGGRWNEKRKKGGREGGMEGGREPVVEIGNQVLPDEEDGSVGPAPSH